MKDKIFIRLAAAYAFLCFFFSFLSWRLVDYGKPDTITLVFLFSGFGLSFLPFASKLNIFGILQIERLQKEVAEVKSALLSGEVVSTLSGTKFFIDEEGRHKVDDKTADFLKSSKGFIVVRNEELKQYPLANDFDSVVDAPLKITDDNGHVFFILNDKKYYVSSWSILIDLNREPEKISKNALREYPTGR